MSGCGDQWVLGSDLSFQSVMTARALMHIGVNILLCVSFIFHRMLLWGHTCFIASGAFSLRACAAFLSSACQPFSLLPYASGYQLRGEEDSESIQPLIVLVPLTY